MPVSYGKRWSGRRRVVRRYRGGKLTKRQAKQVKTIISRNIEKKNHWAAAGGSDVTSSMAFHRMTSLVEGTGVNERVGQRVKLNYLHFRYTFSTNTSGLLLNADERNRVRLIIFQWKMDDDYYAPTQAEILETLSGFAPEVLQLTNVREHDKFTLLYDRTHDLFNTPTYNGTSVSPYAGPASQYTSNTLRLNIKKARKYIDFNEDGTDFKGTGHIYCAVISDSSVTPHPQYEITWNFGFTDA